jgi:hypothetical protein
LSVRPGSRPAMAAARSHRSTRCAGVRRLWSACQSKCSAASLAEREPAGPARRRGRWRLRLTRPLAGQLALPLSQQDDGILHGREGRVVDARAQLVEVPAGRQGGSGVEGGRRARSPTRARACAEHRRRRQRHRQ